MPRARISQKRLVAITKRYAEKSTVRTHQVVAIQVIHGVPVRIRTNQIGSGCVSKRSYHAEELLCRNSRLFRGSGVIYVMRITAGGRLGNSKPCFRCQHILQEYLMTPILNNNVWFIQDGRWSTTF